jgi:hypothetical protein
VGVFYGSIFILLMLGAISSIAFLSDKYESRDDEL